MHVLFAGKAGNKMDDGLGYPYFRKPPHINTLVYQTSCNYTTSHFASVCIHNLRIHIVPSPYYQTAPKPTKPWFTREWSRGMGFFH